ncbi:MAG: DUF1491 family protein [Pseudomonadota bacterium]
MPRLTSSFWVDAYIQRLQAANIPVYVRARGDATAGAVVIKCATLDGRAKLFQRGFDPTNGTRGWNVLIEGDEASVDEAASRQQGFDPDLWVLEIEDRDGRTLLDEPGLDRQGFED